MRPAAYALFLLLPALRADGLSDLRAALKGLPGAQPVKATVECQVWSRNGKAKQAKVVQGRVQAKVEAGPGGLRLGWDKAELDRLLGFEVPQFCYPFGDADVRVAKAARDAGHVASPTVRRGRARRGKDLFMLPRVAIDNADSLAKFALRVFTPLEDLRARKAA